MMYFLHVYIYIYPAAQYRDNGYRVIYQLKPKLDVTEIRAFVFATEYKHENAHAVAHVIHARLLFKKKKKILYFF